MKLYGVAIAIVPKKDQPSVRSITCTPIAMDQENQRSFEILDNLKYQEECDSMDVAASAQAFARMVKTIESVTDLQEKSCKKARIKYVPAALVMGQHSQQRMKVDGLYTLLFGAPTPFDDLHSPQGKQVIEEDIALYRPVRNAYLAEHGQLPHAFRQACRKAAPLANKCVFMMGNYRSPDNPENHPELLIPNEVDAELRKLKPLFAQGDKGARNRLIEIAAETGKKFADGHRLSFPLGMLAPRNYASDPALQERLPRFSFYHWDPAFHDAFQEAYSRVKWGGGYQSVKLPLDPANPFFTDVVADLIRTEFQISEGKRDPKDVHNHNYFLQKGVALISPAVSQEPASSREQNH